MLTHPEFEMLWSGEADVPRWLLLFSSPTCGPCARLDKLRISQKAASMNIPFYIVDTRKNPATSAFCNVTRVPMLLLMEPRALVSVFQNGADTERVLAWLEECRLAISS